MTPTPPLGVIRIGLDRILLPIGSGIRWYGLLYAVAFLVAFRFAALPHLLAHGVSRPQAERLAGWTILGGLVGARLYYVVQNNPLWYATHPQHVLAVWEGGMAFFGAIIAAVPTLAFLAHRERLPIWPVLDAGALFAVVGQPIGRIGNVINGDILGAPSTLPWATAYTNPHAVIQHGFGICTIGQCVAYQPAAVYEAIATVLVGVVLFGLRRHRVRDGTLLVSYVALYALSQLLVFQWRASEPPVAWGLKQAQCTSVVVLVIAVPLLVAVWRRSLPPRDAPSAAPPPHASAA